MHVFKTVLWKRGKIGELMQYMQGRRVGEEEEEEKNRGKVFPCMMTDGLYLDDATQRGGELRGRLPGKSKKGWKIFLL